MNRNKHIHVFDKAVNPDSILLIMPYRPPFDPARAIYEDLNSTLILRQRPHRLHARRNVVLLADQLGFRLADGPVPIGLNPDYDITVAEENGNSILFMTRRGEKHRIVIPAAPEALRSALAAPIRSIGPTKQQLSHTSPPAPTAG